MTPEVMKMNIAFSRFLSQGFFEGVLGPDSGLWQSGLTFWTIPREHWLI